jgi:hypothetical protein
MTKQTKAEQLAERIRKDERVISAKALGRRVYVLFPRELGGYSVMTLAAAERLADRIENER